MPTQRGYKHDPREQRPCTYCGETFAGRSNDLYCSKWCRDRADADRLRGIPECGLCGEPFTSTHCRQRHGTATCRRESAEIISVLRGGSVRYANRAARLAAASGDPSTPSGASRRTSGCRRTGGSRTP